MARYRRVKKNGNTWMIALTTPDREDLGLELGDEVNIEDVVIKKKRDDKKNNTQSRKK